MLAYYVIARNCSNRDKYICQDLISDSKKDIDVEPTFTIYTESEELKDVDNLLKDSLDSESLDNEEEEEGIEKKK